LSRPPTEAYFGRADVPSAVQCSAVQCVGLAREVVLWHGFDHQRAGWCWLKRLCPPLRLGQSPSRGVFWEGGCPIRSVSLGVFWEGGCPIRSAVQCVRLAREVVLWHGFGDQSWMVLVEAPLPAAAIGTIALPRRISGGRMSHPQCVPRRISGGRMSHPQCVGLEREVVLWHGFDDQSWVVLALAPLPAAAGVTSRAPTGAVLLKSPLPDARLPRFSKS